MNIGLFRLVFKAGTGLWVPVAEVTNSRGKATEGEAVSTKLAFRVSRKLPVMQAFRPLCLCLALALGSSLVHANPSNPTVVNGSASLSRTGNSLTIVNSPNTIINWGSFSIDKGEATRFVQQSSASGVLNRVTGQDPSQILGQLQSNGRVFLINPNGVLFGQGAQIDVAGLVASSLYLSNEDFLNGRLRFADSGSNSRVHNAGNITTHGGGQVLLIAPNVENSGVITTPNGEVILAAGHSVELADSTNPALRVQISAPDGQAINLGSILAESGRIGMHGGLLRQDGQLSASSAVAEGGRVFLKANRLLQSGSISADSGNGNGGAVTVEADRIIQTQGANISTNGSASGGSVVVQAGASADGRLFSSGTFAATGKQGGAIDLLGNDIVLLNAHADASGDNGGGRIRVGGDQHGANQGLANAQHTAVNFSSTFNVDAKTNGNAGDVVVWSDQRTEFYGAVSARGGIAGGNGGFVEVSGKKDYYFGGHVDAGAATVSRELCCWTRPTSPLKTI